MVTERKVSDEELDQYWSDLELCVLRLVGLLRAAHIEAERCEQFGNAIIRAMRESFPTGDGSPFSEALVFPEMKIKIDEWIAAMDIDGVTIRKAGH